MSGRTYRVGDAVVAADLRREGDRLVGTVGDVAVDARVEAAGREVVLRLAGRSVRALVVKQGADVLVSVDGRSVRVRAADDASDVGATAAAASPFATSPMTGLVTKVSAVPGAEVSPGDVLFVVEAMKMEYVVRADRAASVAEVRRKAGDRVTQGEVVVAYGSPRAGRA